MSEAETVAESQELTVEGWKVNVGNWAFCAKPDDQPDKELLDWVCDVWGDADNTAAVKTVSDVMCAARDEYAAARQGWEADHKRVHDEALTGNAVGAAQMQISSDMYSQQRKESIQQKLDEILGTGLAEL